jgi:hypothetical protein
LFSAFCDVCEYFVVVWFAVYFCPFTVSYLALEPFFACEASVLFYPVVWLGIEDYWAGIDSSAWLKAEHYLLF